MAATEARSAVPDRPHHDHGYLRHLRAQIEYFTARVAEFLHPHPDVDARLAQVVRMAGVQEGERVLDAGAGTGPLLPHLLAAGADVTALDLTPAMLSAARERFSRGPTFVAGDMATFPGHQHWDVVFCNDSLWNLYDQRLALVRFRELLAPGGRLVISHPQGAAYVAQERARNPDVVLDDPVDDGPLQQRVTDAGLDLSVRMHVPVLYALIARCP